MRCDRRRTALVVALLLLTLVPACSTTRPVNRFGGDSITLRIGTTDGLLRVTSRSYAQQTFVSELQRLSEGRIRIELVTDVADGQPDAEARLVNRVADGDLDAGYPATRAFASAGIEGLEAIEAPLVLTNPQAVEDVLTGEGARLMRTSLEGSGLVALGFAFDGLRIPFASTEPLRSTRAWAATRFRVYGSPVQADAVRALGGQPVSLTHHWAGMVQSGELDGVELTLDGYHENSSPDITPEVAPNVVLWPKVYVFVVNEAFFDGLSSVHQQWLVDAARLAREASFAGPRDDDDVMRELCQDGVRFGEASDRQLAGLRRAVAPVNDALAADDKSGPLMEQVRLSAMRHPEISTPDVPADCNSADASVDKLGPPSALPDGVYRVQIPVADVESAGLSNGDGWSGIWTLDVKDATYALTCRPLDLPGKDCGGSTTDGVLEAGHLVGTDEQVAFVSDYGVLPPDAEIGCTPPANSGLTECGPAPTYTATWALEDDLLLFTDGDGHGAATLLINPWVRIS